MGKPKGIIKMVGKVGLYTYYYLNGVLVARQRKGPTSEQIRDGENYEETRKNNNEFGGASGIAKDLRLVIGKNLLKKAGDDKLNFRLNGLFRNIIQKDPTGINGQKDFALSQHRSLMTGFEFNQTYGFKQVCAVAPLTQHNAARNQAMMRFKAGKWGHVLNAPKGATHAQVLSLVVPLSDYLYNADVQAYVAQSFVAYQWRVGKSSGLLDLNTDHNGLELVVGLPNGALPGALVNLVHLGAIVFYDSTGAELVQGRCMQVLQVF